MKEVDKFFVYGTLLEGGFFAQEFELFRKSSVKAKLKGYDLWDFYHFPGIIPGKGVVYGELQEYNHLHYIKKRMDQIEGYDKNNINDSLFVKKVVDVELENGKTEKANVYVFNLKIPANSVQITSGKWQN